MGTHYGYRPSGNSPYTPTPTVISDPQFNYVSLLLHGDGTNGAQNNTFLDSSSNNFTITRNGNTTQGSLSPYGNLWSNYFSSTSTDFLSLPSNTATNLSNSNFTFEAWFNKVGNPAQAVNLIWWNGNSNNSSHSGLRIQLNNDRTISLLCSETGSSWQISTSSTAVYADFAWNHVAAVRNGQTVTVYLNGVSVCSGSLSSSTASLYAGTLNYINNMAYTSGTWKMVGYVSNLRLVKGTALYTSNFTPSTTPLTAVSGTSLLTCQSNRFIDNSANNFTITRNGDVRVTKEAPFLPTAAYSTSVIGGSGYFDGTGDYLTAPSSTAFNFGTGDFTVEAWINPSTVSGTKAIMGIFQGGVGGWYFGMNGASLRFSSGLADYDAGTLVANVWSHVAATVSGGNLRMFINGVQVNTTTNVSAQNFNFTNSLWVGNINTAGWTFTGYISDPRVVKGTAVYTAAFTPPTAPLTAITNTSLLLNFTNAGIFDNAAENNLETVGNAQISTSVKKYGTGSLAFDGNGDGLVAQAGQNLNLSTGNFTVEGWVYATSNSDGVVASVSNGTAITSPTQLTWAIYFSSGSLIGRIYIGGSFINVGTPPAVSTATWTHFALVRNGSVFTFYVNGTSAGTYTASSALNSGSDWKLGVGSIVNDTSAGYLNGYIDDLRITKGVARYTANFTPPTAAFPDQ